LQDAPLLGREPQLGEVGFGQPCGKRLPGGHPTESLPGDVPGSSLLRSAAKLTVRTRKTVWC
jgi:hypothetical protein